MVFLLLTIILGAAIGSFLTVVIFRFPTKETIIWGRSHCPQCRHVLSPWDLIPILSYLLRRGRCAYCKAKISWKYPLIEFMTMIIFVFVFFLLRKS